MGLLLAIGRDCAGALAVLPDDAAPADDDPAVPLDADDLAHLVETRGQAMPLAAGRPRFSLAGAQDKVAVYVESGGLWLPTRERPSTHILKFETVRCLCFAEYVANALARESGLAVPGEAYRLHAGDAPAPYLQVTRYDCARDATGRVHRIHQEDVTQAMALPSAVKYQEDGGPGLGAVAALIRRHSADPVRDIAILRDWQIFNYLAGNSDGHAKNLALLYDQESPVPRLAPLYDLVCIEFLNRLGMHFDRRLAFFVGTKNVPEEITRHDWAACAKDIGVPPKRLLERLRAMAEQLPALARATRARFAEDFGDNPAFDRFEESIADCCSWGIRSAFGRG